MNELRGGKTEKVLPFRNKCVTTIYLNFFQTRMVVRVSNMQISSNIYDAILRKVF